MTLLYPVWLLLALPLAVLLWSWPPPGRLQTVLRASALGLALLALCGLAITLPSRAGTVVVVCDRSASMPDDADRLQLEAIGLLQSASGSDDRLAVVSFGHNSELEQARVEGSFAGFQHEIRRDASNLTEALDMALSVIPPDAPGKVLVLSDGRWTGRDPSGAAARAAARDIALDFRLLERPRTGDLAIDRIDAPASVGPNEAFLVTAWVRSPSAQEVEYALTSGERVVSSGKQKLVAGLNRLTFRDRAADGAAQLYQLQVKPAADAGDPVPGNNLARLIVGVRGPRKLLHVTRSPGSGLAKLLQKGGLSLQVTTPEKVRWSLDELGQYSAVLLENVPAEQVGFAGMETLALWVRDTGSGLMMTGGRGSYGPGGYHKSPIDPILPVSMELRNEHRKLSLAIVVALDRSGSMAMPVPGGRTKMDLANLGTASVLDLLGPMDEFGCIAVDEKPHLIAALDKVRDKGPVKDKILRIQSQGGGIFVYNALEEAARMLTKAQAGTKHIILFSDANDSEEPGNYKDLLDKCRQAGVTVSVIGLGKKTDVDSALLEDIAKRGNGRIFFTDKPEELPRLFAQDTLVVARNTFIDEPTPIKATGGLAVLTGKDLGLAKSFGGYNLTYLRPEANLAALTVDEYKAPVVASWQVGTGRVLCYTGDADDPKLAGEMKTWEAAGDFYTSLARWATGQTAPLPDNMLLTQEVRNGVNVVRLHLDPERKADAFAGLPKGTTLRAEPGQGPRSEEGQFRWAGPDTLELELPLKGSETSLTTVKVPIPNADPVALPPVCLPYSPEFRPGVPGEGQAALEKLARATGGKERIDLKAMWKELPRRPRSIPLAATLLTAAAVLFLLEVLERRTGLLTRPRRVERAEAAAPAKVAKRGWTFWKRKPRPAVKPIPQAEVPAMTPPTPEPTPAPTPAPAPAAEAGGMVDALRKARQRSRPRTD